MSELQLSLLLFLGSLLAGGVGALTGLGGGVILVPLLVLGFNVDLHYALGASLVSVIATSSGAASAYVREGYSNLRIGMFLEEGDYPTPQGPQPYRVHRVLWGFALMGVAGMLSGLLGIGSGAVKVLAMDRVMGLPYKVSTTTSNFMIGVTAAASAGVYLGRGYIDPLLAMPVMLGVLLGSLLGARILTKAAPARLRLLFVGVISLLGIQMMYQGLRGGL
jgi:uncharacterized membrane protein YfcA